MNFLNIRYDALDVGLGYDVRIQRKYRMKGHTCSYSLGFRVSFPELTDSGNMSVRLLLLTQLMMLITMRSVTVNSVRPSTHQPTKPLNNIQ